MSRKYNIRWTDSDNEELRKAVRNFNAKVDRVAKKHPELASNLPEKVRVKELKELIDTRADLKRELNSLRRFSKKGAEQIIVVPESNYNLKVTKWQLSEMKRMASNVTRKRARRLDELSKIMVKDNGEETSYTRGDFGMGKAELIALEPVKPITPGMNLAWFKKKFKSLKIQNQSTFFDNNDEMLRQSYIKGIIENYNPNDVQDIIREIEEMDIKDFYANFQSLGGTFEYYPPDKEQYGDYLNKLKSDWQPNVKEG